VEKKRPKNIKIFKVNEKNSPRKSVSAVF